MPSSKTSGVRSARELLADKMTAEQAVAEELQAEFQDTVTRLTREVVRELKRRGLATEAAADVVQHKFMQSTQFSKHLSITGRDMVRAVVTKAVEIIVKEEANEPDA